MQDRTSGKFSRYASAAMLTLIFGLIVSTVVFVTFYALGVNLAGRGETAPLSVVSAYCNGDGTFISLKNNLNVGVYVYSLVMYNHGYSIPLGTPTGYPVNITSGGNTFFSATYTCPSFQSLDNVTLSVNFGASASLEYSFNSAYLLGINTNVNMTSGSQR